MGYVEKLLAVNEEIVIRSRQHWIVLAKSFLSNLFFFLALILLAIFLHFVAPDRFPAESLVTVVLLVLAIVPVIAFLRGYLVWWNEEYLVTNRRVIQAEGIFSKHVLDSSLNKINDVALSQSFVGRIFDYGNIEILTASEIGVNLFRTIASPVKFKMAMMEQKGMGGNNSAGVGKSGSDVATLIKQLDELHHQGVLTDQEYTEKKAQLLARM